MSILVAAFIILIVAGLAFYAVDLIPLAAPFGNLIKLLIVVLAIVAIIDRARLL